MDVASKNIRELGIDLKNEYNSLSGTDEIRMLQGLQSIIDLQSKKRDLKSFLREVAMIIHRVAPFKEVSIGIRSPSDGLFRYIEVLGITPIAKAEHSKLSYTYEQMFNQESYPFLRISKLTDFRYGAENGTEIVEKDAFSRPSLLKIPRKSKTEMLEADYFDIYLFDQKDNLIGWMEVAQPKDNQMPSMRMIRWLEMYAIAISPFVEQELEQLKSAEFGRQ